MSIFMDLIQHIGALLGFVTIKYDEKIVREALQECFKGVKKINKAMRNASSIGEKQHLEASLRSIRSLCNQIKVVQKKGSGINETKETAKHRVHWDDCTSVFQSRIRTGVISNLKHKDPKAFLTDCKALFRRRIQNALKKDVSVKVNTVFCGEFEIIKGNKILKEYKYFTTCNEPIYNNTNLDLWFEENVLEQILSELEEFRERDSGWALKAVVNLGVNINKFTPQLGSSYIDLPPQIKQRHACINVKNNDNACFAWAVISALYPTEKDPQRISKYPHYSKVLKLKGIQFPMTTNQIPSFEKQNKISINVYILKKMKNDFDTLTTYLTKNKQDKHVNLLLIQDYYEHEDGCQTDINVPMKYHYVWIKDLSRLLSRQLSKHDGKKYFCDGCLRYFHSSGQLKKHFEGCRKANQPQTGNFCDRCLQRFSSPEVLECHVEDCSKMNNCRIKMPELDQNIVKFKNYRNKERAPFIVYADLESILKPINDREKYQEHIPAAIGYYLKCSYDDSLSFYRSYRGVGSMEWFATEMQQLATDLETVFWCPYDIDSLTPQELTEYNTATHCYICKQAFTLDDKKVRDHFHLASCLNNRGSKTTNYRGPAHESCNINYQDSHVVPIVFHNLSGYDSHFILEKIACSFEGKVDLLPITKEKYISFTKHNDECPIQFRFIDSIRFMASSLETLASYLTEYPNLRSQFSDATGDQFHLLTKKGVMPYDYIDSFDKFEETYLPPIDAFYNRLENRKCPKKLYSRGQQVWSTFNIKNLGQYTDLYMKTDILLLADVFEQFRTSCLNTYELDPAHYFTLPGFTWDAMLKYTKQELELLTDIDQLLFIEKGIRGGLSQCSKRRVKANNKYMSIYDPREPSITAIYYDINNQYGWSMAQRLPYGGFNWVDTNIDVTNIPDDSPFGYILEVDLQYPQHLHDLHKDLPFCPEHLVPAGGKIPKLMATLHDKKKYIIHYRNLKQALEHGLILTKVHRVLEFHQSAWLKPYIDLNTHLRSQSKNDFEKNLFKLMNNAVFGKTMENIRKHSIIKLINKWEGRYGAESMISKPEFKSCTVFNENLIAVEMGKTEIFFNKPIYVGMAILDMAKTTIYDFHYGYMVPTFGDNCTVAYTDTDSLVYEIKTQDPYEIMRKDCYEKFDTSDYPRDNIYDIPQVNKKVLGMMKDENNGKIILDYIGLRSKMYTFKLLSNEDELAITRRELKEDDYDDDEIHEILNNIGITKKAKGVKKSVVKTDINFEDYIECLETFNTKTVTQNLIQSDKHHVYSISQNKIGLNPHDDKRHLIPGCYETLPWGHYSISQASPMDIEEPADVIKE